MKENITTDLLYSAVALSSILDQPIDKNGLIKVNYQFVSMLINNMQIAVNRIVEKGGSL